MIRTKRNLQIRKFISEKFLAYYKELGETEFPFLTAVKVARRFKVYSPLRSDTDVFHSIRTHLRRLVREQSEEKLVTQEKHSAALLARCGFEDLI